MTTSTNNIPTDEFDRPPWATDLLADTQVVIDDGEKVNYYRIQDTTFDDGWLRSDETRRLDKMR